jgi:hypothetical protein
MDYRLRDEILSPYVEQNPKGGIRRFIGLPAEVLKRLIEYGFVYQGPWNSCGGVGKLFLPFLERNPLFTAHGYVVSETRKDTRIVIEGVERAGSPTQREIDDFMNTFSKADEVKITPERVYCWYD